MLSWIIFWIVPAIFAYKNRNQNLAKAFYDFYSTLLVTFLGVYLIPYLVFSVKNFLPKDFLFFDWLNSASCVLIFILLSLITKKLADKILPEGFDNFFFEKSITKYITPIVVFIKVSLLLSFFAFAFALTPIRKTIDTIYPEIKDVWTSSTRRILFNTFVLDRLSWQDTKLPYRVEAVNRLLDNSKEDKK
jgi:hypothetical protein